jgi:unsaturated rhamnogalacturonyl hydrolase
MLADMLPAPSFANDSNRPEIQNILVELSNGLKAAQDDDSGLWYQVVDRSYEPANWIETTGSAMILQYILRRD